MSNKCTNTIRNILTTINNAVVFQTDINYTALCAQTLIQEKFKIILYQASNIPKTTFVLDCNIYQKLPHKDVPKAQTESKFSKTKIPGLYTQYNL